MCQVARQSRGDVKRPAWEGREDHSLVRCPVPKADFKTRTEMKEKKLLITFLVEKKR